MSVEDISNEKFVKIDFIPNSQTLAGLGNTKIRLFRADGSYVESNFLYDAETNQIFNGNPIYNYKTYNTNNKLLYSNMLPDVVDESRLSKFSQNLNDNEERIISLFQNFLYQWAMGKTFQDLQTLNLMFLQGFISDTPYHAGPLDPESNIILKELNLLNRLDVITFNSQPHDIFMSPLPGLEHLQAEQFPYVEFFYPKYKSDKLEEYMKLYLTSSFIIKVDNKQSTILIPTTDLIDGKIYEVVYRNAKTKIIDQSNSQAINYDIKLPITFYKELGPNFEELAKNELVYFMIRDARPSNEIFSDLAGFAKELI